MKFTVLAVVLMIGLAIGVWVVERFAAPPQAIGDFVRDLAVVNQAAVCGADTVAAHGLRIEADTVVIADQTCEIVYRHQDALPMAGDGPLPFEEIGYRCEGAAPGPDQTSGQVVVMSGRVQMTSYIKADYDLRGYIPAYAKYLSCEEVFTQ